MKSYESPKCLGMSLGQSPRFVLLKIIITDRILSLFVKNPLTICVAISTVSTKSQWSDLFIALCNIYSDVWRVLRGDSLQYESSYKDDAIVWHLSSCIIDARNEGIPNKCFYEENKTITFFYWIRHKYLARVVCNFVRKCGIDWKVCLFELCWKLL